MPKSSLARARLRLPCIAGPSRYSYNINTTLLPSNSAPFFLSMSLDLLPVELVIAVAELLGPFSSFDFALTSKAHWKLCEFIITKHRQLFAENHTIDATDSAYPYTNHILWDKLKEISANETVGEYVREISLPSQRATYLDGDAAHDFQLSDQSARPPLEDLDRYIKIRQRIEKLYGWEATAPEYTFFGTDWDEWILRGSSEPIIVMLTHYTPHLRVFRFTDLEMDEIFSNAVRIIAASYSRPSLAPKLPFQHLTTVAVAHWDSEMSCHSDWCIFFCAIPSVRNFVANAMSGDESDDSHEYLPVSNVTELVFCNSVFPTSTIENIVCRTPKLERFSYERGDATVSESVTPTPRRDLKALVDHVGHSLQHLVLESRDRMDDEVSFMPFRISRLIN